MKSGKHQPIELCFVDTPKRRTSRQHFNRFERYPTCQHLQKISRGQADDQLLSILRDKTVARTLLIQ